MNQDGKKPMQLDQQVLTQVLGEDKINTILMAGELKRLNEENAKLKEEIVKLKSNK